VFTDRLPGTVGVSEKRSSIKSSIDVEPSGDDENVENNTENDIEGEFEEVPTEIEGVVSFHSNENQSNDAANSDSLKKFLGLC